MQWPNSLPLLVKPAIQTGHDDGQHGRDHPVLRRAAASQAAAHEAVGHGQRRAGDQAVRQQPVVARAPDEGEERADGDVADAPDAHERKAQPPSRRLGGHGELQRREVCRGPGHAVEAEEHEGAAEEEAGGGKVGV